MAGIKQDIVCDGDFHIACAAIDSSVKTCLIARIHSVRNTLHCKAYKKECKKTWDKKKYSIMVYFCVQKMQNGHNLFPRNAARKLCINAHGGFLLIK